MTLKISFEELFYEFLRTRDLSLQRKKQYLSAINAVGRYEKYINRDTFLYKRLDIRKMTKDDILKFKEYLKNENQILYEGRGLKYARGKNTVNDIMKKLRTFFRWAVQNKLIKSSPFDFINMEENKYGTPYYLNIEELNNVRRLDLSNDLYLESQRDIFVFQCCTGCRYGDLLTLTPANIINGYLEYIASKTINITARTIKVPLNTSAASTVEKYFEAGNISLFPTVSLQRYNRAIRKILSISQITRTVTILDSKTGRERKVPLNIIATSHIARRTFIGNIYNKVQDPNLICSMTGHCEGSKAFLRYRSVEDETKRKLVKFLD